jgi:hypothetical protein
VAYRQKYSQLQKALEPGNFNWDVSDNTVGPKKYGRTARPSYLDILNGFYPWSRLCAELPHWGILIETENVGENHFVLTT